MAKSNTFDDLITLFGDRDSYIASGVDDIIVRYGREALDYIVGHIESAPDQARIRSISERIALDDFQKEMESDYPDLVKALFLITSVSGYAIGYEEFEDMISSVCGKVAGEINCRKTPVECTEIYNHIFFRELDFTIESGTPEGRSDNLYTVLKRGSGSSDMVALAYMTIARCSGMPVSPLPGPDFRPYAVYLCDRRPIMVIDILDYGKILPPKVYSHDIRLLFGDHFTEERLLAYGDEKLLLTTYIEALTAYRRGSSALSKMYDCIRKPH